MSHRSWPLVHVLLVLGTVLLSSPAPARGDDWPTWRGPTRDGISRETGLVEKFDALRLTPIWKAEISSGYSGPTVAAGRVYVTDRVTDPRQIERVHCFDSKTGKKLWTHEYDCAYRGVGYQAGPRACVTIDSGRAYALGTMGHLHCLDASDGRVLWKMDVGAEYKIEMPPWGIACTPLIEGELLILQIGGAGGACIVAFDKTNGREIWKALDDGCSYSTPIVVEQGGKKVLVCWTAQNVVGLDPANGNIFWKEGFEPGKVGMNIASPAFDPLSRRLLVSAFFDGSLMLRLPENKLEVERLWRRRGPDERNPDSLHSTISTPVLIGDYVYGMDSYGELRCLDAKTGDRVWEDLTATPKIRWGTIHFVRQGSPLARNPQSAPASPAPDTSNRFWLFNERGELLIARLTPKGFEEISRTKIIDPTKVQLGRGAGVCWSHPAFAEKCVFARNDNELVCVSVAK